MRNAPDYIQFYPTLRCNQHCDFCFNRPLQPVKDMEFEDFRTMADRLALLGVRTLDIMGGEPTLHHDLARFIKHSRQKGLAINLSSNAINTASLEELMARFPEVVVGVSVNDRKTAEEREGFVKRRRPVVKTVSGSTIDSQLVNALLSYGPRAYYLIYRDAMEAGQLQYTAPFDVFYQMARERFDTSRVGTVFCSGFLPDQERYPELLQARCPAGTTKLGILPDGSVYPCNLFFGIESYRLGNILTDPFEKIWRHEALTFFRTFAGNACPRKDCTLHKVCHGGCPAHSLVHHGRRTAPDPRCVRG
jgi:radical SAM protein with 4Fe4S-binding SPASM domain